MTKEEKEKLIKAMKEKIIFHFDRYTNDKEQGYNDGLIEAIELVDDMETTEPKETNLEHYKNKFKEFIFDNFDGEEMTYDFLRQTLIFFGEEPSITIDTDRLIDTFVETLAKPYEKPKYKLSRFEYDLLRTNNMPHDRTIGSYATYRNMHEVGYYKDVDFNLTINEILENCEVKSD